MVVLTVASSDVVCTCCAGINSAAATMNLARSERVDPGRSESPEYVGYFLTR
jgi:hypothetical protein